MLDLARLSEGRRIGLYCRDPRVYRRVLELLRERGVRVVVLDREPTLQEAEGRFDSVVSVGDVGEKEFLFGEFTTVLRTRLEDEVHFLADVLASIRGRYVSKAELGVDPGRRIGIALALDGILVHGEIADDPKRLVEILGSLASYTPRLRRIRIKIGDSPNSSELSRPVIEKASQIRQVEVRVELVSEYEAERRVLVPARARGDLTSAVKILLSKPRLTLYANLGGDIPV